MPFLTALNSINFSVYGIRRLLSASSIQYVEDVFSTYLYTGKGAGEVIVNDIQLDTGFTSFTELGGPVSGTNFGRYNAKAYAKSGQYLFTLGNDAAGNDARFYYSNDTGATWSAATITSSGTVMYGCVFFAGKIFVATNIQVFAATAGSSTLDGGLGGPGRPCNGVGVKVVNGKLFTLHTVNNNPTVTYSDDGVTFTTARGLDSTYNMLDITYGGGYYYLLGVIVSSGTTCEVFRSSDLSNWTSVSTITNQGYNARIAYNSSINRLVVSGGNGDNLGKVFYSDNFGTSFTTVSGISGSTANLDFDGDKFYLGSGGYAYSVNGIDWTRISVPNLSTGTSAFVQYVEDNAYIISQGENYPIGAKPKITTKSITTGKGGLVWLKSRSNNGHFLFDTVRGPLKALATHNTTQESSYSDTLTSFNATGFALGGGTQVTPLDENFATWTFRKQPKFFDIVTYTGNGSASGRAISHNLQCAPGCMIVKAISAVDSWWVYHRGVDATVPAQYGMELNSVATRNNNAGFWANTPPTSTQFTVGGSASGGITNVNGVTYVAYLFAHNDGGFGPLGADNVISCGSYVGDGTTDGSKSINLGYEPQWLLIKNVAGASWHIFDTMRGLVAATSDDRYLYANSSDLEGGNTFIDPTAIGFSLYPNTNSLNTLNNNYIYIAIRRGPMKVPTSGTSVFKPVAAISGTFETAGFPVDVVFDQRRVAGSGILASRLTNAGMATYVGASETSTGGVMPSTGYWDNMTGTKTYYNGTPFASIYLNFRRAPGFMDVVAYTGNGAIRTITHNLGVAPELMIIKRRSSAADWTVYHSAFSPTNTMALNLTAGAGVDSGNAWNGTAPTSSVFTIGPSNRLNLNGETHVAYLFATLPGISKVGSYTGSGGLRTIDCGFTTGARFILIKCTDTGVATDWYIWDSARGISSGNDPYTLVNMASAEVTNTNYVDTDTTGFKLTAASNIAGLNESARSYIFYAIA